MQMDFQNVAKKGNIIIVESSTNDYGKTNNPNGWSYPRLKTNGRSVNLPNSTWEKIKKECALKVVFGGWDNGELKGTVTFLEIQ